jgi:predicted GIY-YIG superfamily endonuclease
MYWVYILQNPTGRFYIGQTDNLSIRLANHNRTDEISGKYTRKKRPLGSGLVRTSPCRCRQSCLTKQRGEARFMLASRLIYETSNSLWIRCNLPGSGHRGNPGGFRSRQLDASRTAGGHHEVAGPD